MWSSKHVEPDLVSGDEEMIEANAETDFYISLGWSEGVFTICCKTSRCCFHKDKPEWGRDCRETPGFRAFGEVKFK